MSLQSVLARISEIQGALAPVQPAPPSTPAAPSGDDSTSFATQLHSAMAGSTTGDPSAGAPTGAAAGAAPAFGKAAPGSYPHLDGDLDASPEILAKLEALAAKKGMKFHVTS